MLSVVPPRSTNDLALQEMGNDLLRREDITMSDASSAAYILKLYVTGTSPRTGVAISNLRRICEQELQGRYVLEIIDVVEHPQLAEDERILATPTLIKQLPPPLRRVIGDLSDKDKVLLGLELQPLEKPFTNTSPRP
jgi:circadian clock protein KaiB